MKSLIGQGKWLLLDSYIFIHIEHAYISPIVNSQPSFLGFRSDYREKDLIIMVYL